MRNRNRGNYDLNIGNLTAGSYEFRAEARKAGRVIDEQTGAFNVTVSTVEFIDTKRDDELLRQLAEVSGGSFLENQNREELMEELQIRNLIDSIEERHTSFRFLYENVFWFILVLLLLSGEWILRRTLALP